MTKTEIYMDYFFFIIITFTTVGYENKLISSDTSDDYGIDLFCIFLNVNSKPH